MVYYKLNIYCYIKWYNYIIYSYNIMTRNSSNGKIYEETTYNYCKKCTNRNSNKGHQLINILLAGEIFFYIIYYEGMF